MPNILQDDSAESESDDQPRACPEEDAATLIGRRPVSSMARSAEQPAHPRVVEFLPHRRRQGLRRLPIQRRSRSPTSGASQGEGTYKEETQAVGEGGELHAQEIDTRPAQWTSPCDGSTATTPPCMQLRERGGDARRRYSRGRLHATASPSRFARRWKTTPASSR